MDSLDIVLDAPWLPGIYLMESSEALKALLPDFDANKLWCERPLTGFLRYLRK